MPKVQTDSGAVYDFPDDAKDEEILDFISSQKEPTGQQFDPSQIKLSPYEQARMAGPMEQMGPVGPIDPMEGIRTLQALPQIPGAIMEPITTAAEDMASDLYRRLGIDPSAQPGQPMFNIPKISLGPVLPPGIRDVLQIVAPGALTGAEKKLGQEVSGFTTPGQTLLLPTMALGSMEKAAAERVGAELGPLAKTGEALQALYAGTAAAAVPEALAQIPAAKTPEELGAAITGAGADIGMAYLMGRPLLKGTRPYAGRIQEAAEVHGDLRAQPIPGERQMPSEEGSARVQPSAQEVAQGAQVPLDPAEAAERAAIDAGAQSNLQLGLPGEVVESAPTDPNQPFARELATVDAEGRIVLNRPKLREWLSQIPAENRQGAIQSLFNEEGIHAVARKLFSNEVVANLWNSLTGAERALVESSYFGKERAAQRANYTDAQMGHEYVRRAMQRLLRMDVREVAELRGQKGAFRERVIDMAERVIQAVRRMLKTGPSTTLDAMLRDMQRKVDVARGAKLEGQAPAAFAKLSEVPPSDIDELRFTVQQPEINVETGEWMPTGYVQVDGFKGGRNIFSSNPEDMRAAGYQVPTREVLMQLPQGRYSHLDVAPESLPAKGMVRLYHGKGGVEGAGMGELWWTDNPKRAASFGEETTFVDVPQAVFEQGAEAVKKTGGGTKGDAILPDEWIVKAKPTAAKLAAEVFDTDIIEREATPAAFAKKKLQRELEQAYEGLPSAKLRTAFAERDKLVDQGLSYQEAGRESGLTAALAELPEGAMGMGALGEAMEKARRIRQQLDEIREQEGGFAAAFAKKKAAQGAELPLKPLAPGEARPGAAEAAPLPPISAVRLEQAAQEHLAGSVRPNFADFTEEVRKRFGEVKPGQIRDLWQEQVWGGLMKATGAELQRLVKTIGLEKQLGRGDIIDPPPEMPAIQRRFPEPGVTRPHFVMPERKLYGPYDVPFRGRTPSESRAQFTPAQQRRAAAIAAIGNKLLRESEAGRKAWKRSEVSTEDLADPKIETKQPVWQAFTTADASNPAELGAALTADARAFGGAKITKSVGGKPVSITQKGLPVSVTKRVTAIQNKTTGKVSLVSSYRDGRRGPVLLDPDAPKGTHSPIDSILKRYRVLNSMLLDEPVQNFRQDFKNIRDYEVNFAQDVRAESEKFAGYEPPEAPEAIVPRGTVRAEGMTADEPKSIIDQIIGEVGDPKSPEDVKLAWEALPQSPEGRTIIESLRKLGSKLMAREPNLSQEQFLDRLATQIYENFSQTKTLEDFQRRTMAQGSPEAGAAPGVAAEPAPRAEAPAAGPAPGAAGVEPAAFAKAREAAEERWAMAKRSISLAMKRREVRGEIPALLDGADNASAQFAVNAGNHVRAQSNNVKVREAAVGLIAAGEIEKPGSLFEGQWFPNPKNLPRLFDNLDAGELRAKQWLLEGNPIKRHFAKKWLRAIDRMREGLRYAQDHWNDEDLQNVAMAIRKELKDTLEWENANGSDVQERQGFYPGRYEGGFWMDNGINFGPQRILGGQFRLPKTFTDPYDAISKGPYIQASFDPADVVESRVRSGHRIVERKLWQEAVKGMRDPGTGQPIAKDPVPFTVKVKDPRTGDVTEEVRYKSPSPEYELVKPFGWQKPIAVRSSYVSLVRSVTAGSRIAELPVGKEALMLASQLKHGVILIADTFHPARVGQYAAALLGLGKVGFKGGYAAISFRPEDLPDAVRQGYITQAQADWAMEPVSLKVMRRRLTPSGSITAPETIKMTRQQVATELISRGLNAARISDALYRDAVQNIPFVGESWHKLIGPFNNWLFGRFMPGLITETAVRNLESINNKNPGIPLHRLIRDVIKDTNIFYGNMGRQGIFRNATFRDLAQIFLLAPLWQEGLIQKEVRFASRLTGLSQLTGRAGLPYLGTLGRGMANGLLTYFALSQLVNLATRRQFTWQNKEEGHKLDAWIPAGEGKGFWLSPLAVFGEVTHDLIRLGETKPTVVDAIEQMGANRAGPVGKLFYTLVKGKTPMGEQYTTSKARLWGAASQVVPFAGPGPISFAGPGRAIAHALFPERVRPPPRGTLIRQGLASLGGMKVQPSETAVQMVSRAAERFVKAQGLKKSTGWIQVQTDEASYSKLRSAIRNDDPIAIRENYLALRKDHSDAEMLKAMRLWARRGFTGSKAAERDFVFSLDDAGLELYSQANQEKQAVKEKFEDWLVKQPVTP